MEPIVMHPTAATPSLYNCYAAPFVFLVLGLPYDYRKWLVTTAVHEVGSNLCFLLVENGRPVAHDYVVFLNKYNLRTDMEVLWKRAHNQVRKSVVDLLFDKPSNTSQHIAEFIRKNNGNIDKHLTGEDARLFIRNSVWVNSLSVVYPVKKTTGLVYNVYIHPPTTDSVLFKRWRDFIAGLEFYAGIYGMGSKYENPWKCLHCKSINHPTGLCPLCQEIGLVAFMFFFELLFPYVSSSISLYVSFTNLFSIIPFPYLLITQDTQDEGEARFDSTSTGTV